MLKVIGYIQGANCSYTGEFKYVATNMLGETFDIALTPSNVAAIHELAADQGNPITFHVVDGLATNIGRFN